MTLVEDVRVLLNRSPAAGAVMGLKPFTTFAELAGTLFVSLTGNVAVGQAVAKAYASNASLVELSEYDIEETARRNFEPGGEAATFLFSRGAQAVIAHRVAHQIWTDGDKTLALAIKSVCGRVLDTDIHPAARIGAGLWLDHGLGVVIGETSVIEEDVSVWHNVTLGSTLSDDGPRRHPHIERGVVIGAGCIILGGLTIGEGANIAAGSIVVNDVEKGALIAGQKAQPRGAARITFSKPEVS